MKLHNFNKIITSLSYSATLSFCITACGENPTEASWNKLIVPAKLKNITSNSEAVIRVSSEKWGEADGKEIRLYTLKNDKGMVVRAINWGAYVQSVIVPDRDGSFEDVVIGYDNWDEYYNDCCYSGPVVGRFGNRIAKGKFTIDGIEYNVTRNNGGPNNDMNQLHGGLRGLHKRAWDASQIENGVEMTYVSIDGEEGYPGNLKVIVAYTLNNDNEFKITYEAISDKKTPINLTWHAYFNLSGNMKRDIEGQMLLIKADKITPVDDWLIPTGELLSVEGTPFDFRSFTAIGSRIRVKDEQLKKGGGVDKEFGGYDHNWVFTESNGSLAHQVTMYDPKSGRVMEIFTQEPALQFYSGNFMDGTVKGKAGKVVKHRYGIALEPQNYPDAPNQQNFPNSILAPGETYSTSSVYRFGFEETLITKK